MSLLLATLIPGLFLIALGIPLLLVNSGFIAALKAFPRSTTASYVFFGGAAAWFLFNIWHLSSADFGDYRIPLFFAFFAIAALAFKCVPDFLAVRGLCILVLLAASPLLYAAYMEFEFPKRRLMAGLVYVALASVIWIGAQPWRLRDFFEWLFARPSRTRTVGGILAAYGILLAVVALTY